MKETPMENYFSAGVEAISREICTFAGGKSE